MDDKKICSCYSQTYCLRCFGVEEVRKIIYPTYNQIGEIEYQCTGCGQVRKSYFNESVQPDLSKLKWLEESKVESEFRRLVNDALNHPLDKQVSYSRGFESGTYAPKRNEAHEVMDKCEICGSVEDLTQVFACACDENSTSATLCKSCRDKYFEKNFVFGYRYYPNLSFAENLVEKYKIKHGEIGQRDILFNYGHDAQTKKEEPKMQVCYNGFTGELVKLERKFCPPLNGEYLYDLSIYNREDNVTHSFTGVNLGNVEFLGGAVTFCE